MKQQHNERLGIGGILKMRSRVPKGEEHDIILQGVDAKRVDYGIDTLYEKDGTPYEAECAIIQAERRNAFVNLGLEITLDRLFNLGGPAPGAISHIGVTDDTTAVTATTTEIDAGNAANTTLLPVTNASRTDQTAGAEAEFTDGNANHVYKKVGFFNTSADDGTGLINVIGGGGSSPYNESFTVDFTGASTFAQTFRIEITATAT